ncbi:MAG: hypothetical protein RLZZ90_337, partial [Actinomycetota bacterium]
DLLSLYRDVLTIQLATESPLVNEELRSKIEELAQSSTSAATIKKIDAITKARHRIDSNVRDLMVLESLAVGLRKKAK